MKKHFFAVILAGLALTATTGVLLYIQLQFQRQKQELEQNISKKDFLYLLLKDDQQRILENERCILNPSLSLVNLKNDTISMSNLQLEKGKYLVLFFSAEHCSDCVDYCLTQIKTLLQENEIDKLLLFASKYKLRDLYVYARSNKFPDSVFYNIDSLRIPIEQIKQPFMFILDDELTVSHFFIPRKEIPEQTNQYFKTIKNIR
jgi:hypothetical protein